MIEQQRGGAYTGKTRWQHIAAEANEEGVPVRTIDPEAWGLIDGHPSIASGQFCAGCGAWRGALGLEPTPEQFIAHTVEVFREVRRVLRADGTCWINIGDSYAGGGRGGNPTVESSTLEGGHSSQEASMIHRQMTASRRRDNEPIPRSDHRPDGLKPKDLVGIPWMLAFALRADGWYLRQEIIWHKPNPMPESVRDRCTKAHESLFLLSKSPRYHYDAKEIREETGTEMSPEEYAERRESSPEQWYQRQTNPFEGKKGGKPDGGATHPDGRNKRSVWSIPTEPFPEAHFATYPTALVEPCILAGCPEGGVVLDPFLGSGTTALVARRLGRRCIGIDLKPEYLDMAVRRAGGQLSLELTGEAS